MTPRHVSVRIAIVLNTTWNAVNFRAGLIRSFLANNHEVVVIAPADQFVGDLKKLGASFIPICMDSHSTNPIKDLYLVKAYWRVFRGENIDCILTYTTKPNIYGSLVSRILKIPVVNNISGLGAAFINRPQLAGFMKLLYRVCLSNSRHVFFQNKEDRHLFVREKLVKEARTSVLPGSGIDSDIFCSSKSIKSYPKFRPTFLLIARLLWNKGIREYVHAAELVKGSHPEAKFQLLGGLDIRNPNGVDSSFLESYKDGTLLEYLGETDDVRPYIENCDCIVLPSYREGLPRVLLEAGAMSKPAIATDVEGCRDVISQGETGFLCRPRDPQDLASAMLQFINLSPAEREEMGLAARKNIVINFDEKLVIESYSNILLQLES
ncbi:MAG: glycosyltransferase family 4 protein [Halieaceae bacterium]|nr:glycosyltransferase family 4 protein [Halieaceae bacterium]